MVPAGSQPAGGVDARLAQPLQQLQRRFQVSAFGD